MRGLGFLIPSALLAASTACALRPRGRAGRIGLAAHVIGFPATGMPSWWMGWLVVLVTVSWAAGDLRTPLGLAGLGLAAGSLAGLAVLAAAGTRAGGVLTVALRDSQRGLPGTAGEDFADSLRVPRATVAEGLLPMRRRRRDVEHLQNLRYGGDGGHHRLDVYRARDRASNCPVLVHFHGGHFVSGSKDRESLPLLYHLAATGWVTVSADYGLGLAAAFPQAHVDAHRVLAWVRQHIADYGGDPAQVIVAGNSAGAHLALFAALSADNPSFRPGFDRADTTVAAAIGLGGYYGPLIADRPDSSPAAHVHPQAPPVLLLHGSLDPLVDPQHARAFADSLRAGSRAAVVQATLPRAGHALDYFHSARTRAVIAAVDAFGRWAITTRSPDTLTSRP